ncbi:RecQ family ATP-dependent DNA helicase [Kushneria indalinina]|uniref:ATP-dependent DNA helicase RecQ n=1 Tax=Kushneria indalinina DSM 14324 TaxID=1122140 RepID=A0A3D9DSD8_9GAMM|nr:RecQ family ATP-dependent DNA helicase [Kushneria indalinina]REC93636.1 RecQ-like ATP-dependent DNA helicase [Kushneria indalinina DSM 14324]
MPTDATDTAHQTLETVFGLDDFRTGQQPVIERVLAGRSTAAIFATGAGKSLCYQLPALHLPHLTLVISPLLALMQDQLAFLKSRGIAAASIDSTMDRDAVREVMTRARQGELKILMVSVERLRNERFRHFLQQVAISSMVIDEAHCISEWGHNFRPDYLRLPEYQREFNIPQVLLLTATATPQVIQDMQRSFAIDEGDVITTGFYRPNLNLQVRPVAQQQRVDALIEWLAPQQVSGQEAPTIIYVTLQQGAETVARALSAHGIQTRAYHAGLGAEIRDEIQQQFMRGEVPVIVATIAFGMGIDKRNIRNVVHFDLPKSIENYSQEIGRAGRDGAFSTCLMLAGRDGLGVLENFTHGDTPEREGIQRVLEEIQAAGQTPERQWPVVMNTLSRDSNIRALPLKTLLVRLEMMGVIAPRFTYLAEYRLRYQLPPAELAAKFEGERADFIRLVIDNIPIARTWGTVDFERVHQAGQHAGIDATRTRVITALEYFQDKGWVVLEGKRMTDVFEVCTPDIDPVSMARELHEGFCTRERADIERLSQMLSLFESDTCLTRRLALHFGDTNAPERCGHCSVCDGHVARLPAPPTSTPLESHSFEALAGPLIARHQEQFQRAPTPERVAHFLCALAMPVFTPLKVRGLKTFGALEGYTYPQVRQWAEQHLNTQG